LAGIEKLKELVALKGEGDGAQFTLLFPCHLKELKRGDELPWWTIFGLLVIKCVCMDTRYVCFYTTL
jgi:hypothetical protein